MNNHICRLVARRDNFRCVECGLEEDENTALIFHHLLPRCMGGKDTLENLVTVCRLCHGKIEYVKYSNKERREYKKNHKKHNRAYEWVWDKSIVCKPGAKALVKRYV